MSIALDSSANSIVVAAILNLNPELKAKYQVTQDNSELVRDSYIDHLKYLIIFYFRV